MPGLQSVSNSDEDDDEDESESDYESDEGEYEDEDGGYNTDEEDEMRELWKEAMQAARDAEYLDVGDGTHDANPFAAEDHRGNSFLKTLSSLRGESASLFLVLLCNV